MAYPRNLLVDKYLSEFPYQLLYRLDLCVYFLVPPKVTLRPFQSTSNGFLQEAWPFELQNAEFNVNIAPGGFSTKIVNVL